VDACAHRLLFFRRLQVGVENVEWTMLESILAQVSEDFQDILQGSVRAGECNEFFLAKLLSPPFKNSAPETVLDFYLQISWSTIYCQTVLAGEFREFKTSRSVG
jgi:hypothetical protein